MMVISPEGERQAALQAPKPPLDGDELLAAVAEAMVELHRRYYRRKPVTAKTRILGYDLLACILDGVDHPLISHR